MNLIGNENLQKWFNRRTKCRTKNNNSKNIGTEMHVFWHCDRTKGTGKRFTKLFLNYWKDFLSSMVYVVNCPVQLCLDCDEDCVLNFSIYWAKKKSTFLLWSTAQVRSVNM